MDDKMIAIRTIQTVHGLTLTVPVPAEFSGQQVEVIIRPLTNGDQPPPPEHDSRHLPYIMAKPQLTQEQIKELERDPNPLRGSILEYIDPCDPAVPSEDWDVYLSRPTNRRHWESA